MTLLLCFTASLLIITGLAALVAAVRHAPEGFESGEGFTARPVRRPARHARDEGHAVSFPGSAVLH